MNIATEARRTRRQSVFLATLGVLCVCVANRPIDGQQPTLAELKQVVARDPRSGAAHLALGQAYLASGSIDLVSEAKAELQQALDLDSGLIWARFYLAKIYLDLGRADKARAELERAEATRPNVPHILSLLGEACRRLGEPERALELNQEALEVDASMTPAYYHRALAYLDLKKPGLAAQELERAVQSQYVIPEMFVTLGAIYSEKGDLDRAGALFSRAIALDASRPEGHLKLAGVLRRQGAYERALAELKRALPEGKRFLDTPYYQQLQADVAFETGQVYQDQGKMDQARQAFSRALEIDPNHAGAKRSTRGLKPTPAR